MIIYVGLYSDTLFCLGGPLQIPEHYKEHIQSTWKPWGSALAQDEAGTPSPPLALFEPLDLGEALVENPQAFGHQF